MWDKVEKLFPELLPAIQRKSIPVRLTLLVVVVGLPTLTVLLLPELVNFLSEGGVIHIPVRMLVFASTVTGIAIIALWVLTTASRSRRRIVQFVQEWREFSSKLALLHVKIEAWLSTEQGLKDPMFESMADDIQDFFARRASLRGQLFRIGEQVLNVGQNQYWLELKSTEDVFNSRDYATPFSYLLDLRAPIANVNLEGKAIWTALQIAEDYIEDLVYKFPYLKHSIKNSEVESDQGTD